MSEPSVQPAAAPAPPAKPLEATPAPRPLWMEFLVFFAVGFGAMALYWMMQKPPGATPRAPTVAAKGKPLIELGAKPGAQKTAPEPAAPDAAQEKSAALADSAKTEPAKTVEAAKTEAKSGDDETYSYTTWETLAGYMYQPPDPEAVEIPGMPKPKHDIPKSVQDLTGKRVLVSGFMVPLRTKRGEVTEFVICKTVPTCCFGDSIRMNEWIHVKMPAGKSCQYIPNQSVTVFGTMEVGELLDQGIVISIYRMKADQVAAPPEL
ncbi:MAG: DUF3299 domain-containing protein [Planctomycetota bacterium]|nr:DUF3299 domain-containing protein [Planctomycetota bacterium]